VQRGKIFLIKLSGGDNLISAAGSICVALREPIATRDVFSLGEGIKASATAFRVQCDGNFSPPVARSLFSFCKQQLFYI